MIKQSRIFSFFLLILLNRYLSPDIALAKVTGQCSTCHTMHNSQNASDVTSSEGPYPNLLNTDCLGCHLAPDATTAIDSTTGAPIVYNTSAPQYGSFDGVNHHGLAGGNFYWVGEGDDTKGHNVFIDNPDDNLSVAPGAVTSCGLNGCHNNLHEVNTNFGTRQGCSKCHIMNNPAGPSGSHHADDSNIVVGSDIGDTDGYFRFLQGHMSGAGHGVCGIEDDDWQGSVSSIDHNEYLGYSGTKTSSGNISLLGHTITGFCCGCHGNFHIEQDGDSDWIRHPSDAILPISGEYGAYTIYDWHAPVARPSLEGWTGPSSSVNEGGTIEKDMVMCISCHRAHGSPYPDMLRWDCSDRSTSKCDICHTQKGL